jgi:hypothetical protein
VLLTTAGDGFHLSKKENIGLNQLSWPETATQMRVKCGNKSHRTGKVNSMLMAGHISESNHKHSANSNNNLCKAKEQLSKHAKPDACSAVTNTHVCVAAILKAEPLFTQLSLLMLPPIYTASTASAPHAASPAYTPSILITFTPYAAPSCVSPLAYTTPHISFPIFLIHIQ